MKTLTPEAIRNHKEIQDLLDATWMGGMVVGGAIGFVIGLVAMILLK